MSLQDPSSELRVAVARADLGLPIPKGTRFRFPKRVFARLSWIFLRHQVAFNTAVTTELASLRGFLAEQESDLAALRGLLGEKESDLAALRELLDQQQTALRVQVDLVQKQAFARHHEGLSALRSELTETAYQIGELHKKMESEITQLHAEAESRVIEARRRQGAVDLLLNEVRRSLPGPPSPEDLSELPRAMDAIYGFFEDVFRGPPALVKERATAYLPDVVALDRHGPVVDLGSGRGEWLELLKDAGIDAYGVETSDVYTEESQARGLRVVHADVCDHLAAVAERSLAAVTAFHLAEHLPMDRLIQLVDLSLRALQPGGLLILETPNPENLLVGAASFYLDPTHVRPLPPGLLAFLLEARGFADVETRLLHPSTGSLRSPSATEPWSADLTPLVEVINDRLFGAQDYAVLGRRV